MFNPLWLLTLSAALSLVVSIQPPPAPPAPAPPTPATPAVSPAVPPTAPTAPSAQPLKPTKPKLIADKAAEELLRTVATFHATQLNLSVSVTSQTVIKGVAKQPPAIGPYPLAFARPNRFMFTSPPGSHRVSAWSDGAETTYLLEADTPGGAPRFVTRPPITTYAQLRESPDATYTPAGGLEVAALSALLGERVFDDLTEGAVLLKDLGTLKHDSTAYRVVRVLPDADGKAGCVEYWFESGDRPFLARLLVKSAGFDDPAPVPAPGADPDPAALTLAPFCDTTHFTQWSTAKIKEELFRPLIPAAAVKVPELLAVIAAAKPAPAAATATAVKPASVGSPAPSFALPDLTGKVISLADFKGTSVVVLNFVAPWSGPCVRGLPLVQKVLSEFNGKPVVSLTIFVGKTDADARALMTKEGWTFTALLDDGSALRDYAVGPLPHLLVIDRAGIIRAIHEGTNDDVEATLKSEIQAALNATEGPAVDRK